MKVYSLRQLNVLKNFLSESQPKLADRLGQVIQVLLEKKTYSIPADILCEALAGKDFPSEFLEVVDKAISIFEAEERSITLLKRSFGYR